MCVAAISSALLGTPEHPQWCPGQHHLRQCCSSVDEQMNVRVQEAMSMDCFYLMSIDHCYIFVL